MNPSYCIATCFYPSEYNADNDVAYKTKRLPKGIRPESTAALKFIASHCTTPYAFILLNPRNVSISNDEINRLCSIANDQKADIAYSDYYDFRDGVKTAHPLIDYSKGSVSDSFEFGKLMLLSLKAISRYVDSSPTSYAYAGIYAFRLWVSNHGKILHISEKLYVATQEDTRKSGQKQFDYLNPQIHRRQKEMERAFTVYLKDIGAYISPDKIKKLDFSCKSDFIYEASVVIPVRNRERTIADAVKSALSQETDFNYNVIVVNNHSTDKTTEILKQLAAENNRVVHIIPKRNDLGIGGCWQLAADDKRCGRFAVQLDSDDIYSDSHTLQKIVERFHRTHAAMVIGSYKLVDFSLNTLPPGIIDHKEWTSANGRNNALRINGLGAPRAFYTPLIRKVRFPNSSYGEDYAMGLAFSREYYISRIYDVIYLCRRWEGNSDAALSQDKINRNNIYKNSLRAAEIANRIKLNKENSAFPSSKDVADFFARQLKSWPNVRQRIKQLDKVKVKRLTSDNKTIYAQINPARIVSTGAKVDAQSVSKRPCFLCAANRPSQQMAANVGHDFEILVNPFPILRNHITIPCHSHCPQTIEGRYESLCRIACNLNDYVAFYNGAKCGASAPDHLHFQAGLKGDIPIEKFWAKISYSLCKIKMPGMTDLFEIKGFACPALAIISPDVNRNVKNFNMLYSKLTSENHGKEFPMNVLVWTYNDSVVTVIFLRKKHRPDCYFEDGDGQMLISPGSVDMGGLLVTVRENDFSNITPHKAFSILNEVSLGWDEIHKLLK